MSSSLADEASVEEPHDVETPRRTFSIKLASGALKRTAIWTNLHQKLGEASDIERSLENDSDKYPPSDYDQLVPVPWHGVSSMSILDTPTNSAEKQSPSMEPWLSPASNSIVSPSNSLDVASIVELPYSEDKTVPRNLLTPVLPPARPCTPIDKTGAPSVWEIAPAQLRYALESVLSDESHRASSPCTAERSNCSPSSSLDCSTCCLQSPKPRLWVEPPSTPRRVVLGGGGGGGGSGSASATPRTPKRPAPMSQRDFTSTASNSDVSDIRMTSHPVAIPSSSSSSLSVPVTFPEVFSPPQISPAKMPRKGNARINSDDESPVPHHD
mmetsp:Transcript_23810/g.39160  ORF Transcript_23810/g.39160 Transcript_23810/m.39160 type:complete len:326 (+) Transcript_23810:169-1146(+)|eukprot:CAMPEP_0184648420 /NCGR_PEP_ID=MMETSP0308-20130426/5541_1 /TAXON_ID=38269 /ORGANISM="Gloeochaete witrockiana, Strain SAG 46.84" /LENGTH=325 /DNA_ID=CAMNT_0027080229 /DNA_START=139 /DNA_END=1116 /DNA_ORIENTATION=+